MNPLTMLHHQNRTYEPKIIDQAQELFEKISHAILKDMNYIEYSDAVFPVNRIILMLKGYFITDDGRIVWNDYKL